MQRLFSLQEQASAGIYQRYVDKYGWGNVWKKKQMQKGGNICVLEGSRQLFPPGQAQGRIIHAARLSADARLFFSYCSPLCALNWETDFDFCGDERAKWYLGSAQTDQQ